MGLLLLFASIIELSPFAATLDVERLLSVGRLHLLLRVASRID